MKFLVIFATALIASQAQTPDWEPRFLGQTNLQHAAFLSIFRSDDTSLEYEDQYSMYISTFDPALVGVNDRVWYMRSMGRYLDNVTRWDEDHINQLDRSAVWPNDIMYAPAGVAGDTGEGILQTSGFLVTGKTNGQLQYYDTTVEPPAGPINIAADDSNEWSYHRVLWKDMDLDGDLDAVTCRFHVPLVGNPITEFMWFENENIGFVEGWTEHIISDVGPDVSFAEISLTVASEGRSYDAFVFGELFNERTSILWTDDINGDWSDVSQVSYRTIMETGQAFDVLVEDFNRDGVLEFAASEYTVENNNGVLRIYFIPDDFRVDTFTTEIIATGFEAPPSGAFSEYMTPGTPKIFYPTSAYANELAEDGLSHKPWILLSGDDSGCFYILTPDSDDRSDWTYQTNLLIDSTGETVGKMDHADLDGDGYEELVLPAYSSGQLYVFSYAP